MAEKIGDQRKLHPRLRMIGNGSDLVNYSRAELSGTVVSTLSRRPLAAVPEKVVAAVKKPDMLFAPGNEAALNLSVPHKKREKIQKAGRATNAFVNVVIEVQRDQDGEAEAAAESLKSELLDAIRNNPGAREVGAGAARNRNLVSATVSVADLDRLRDDERVSSIQPSESLTFRLPTPKLGGNGKAPVAASFGDSSKHKGGANVIIGIIDVNGFDFAHPDFADGKGGTRFIAIWDQAGDFRPPPAKRLKALSAFAFGSEFTKKQMDEAIRASKDGGLPATEIERQSQRFDGSHGTHVASIAAGTKAGVCPKAQIAAVLIDVPRQDNRLADRRMTFSDSTRILEAVQYLLEIARIEKKPISINISLGTNGGSHDGASSVSRWLDALLATPGRSICVAAGNAGQEKPENADDIGFVVGRIHASAQIAAKGLDVDLDWTVVGDSIVDVSENELEVWFSPQDKITVQLRPPGGSQWLTVRPGEFVENKRLGSGTFVSIYNELYHPANGANFAAIYLSPDYRPGSPKGVESGVWTVRLTGEDVRNGRFHCWIERDDPFEFDRVGQRRIARFPSYFSERSNVDSHSVNSLACGNRVISVANLDAARQRINITSSQGPTRDNREKPDIAAPGTDIVAARGFAGPDDLWVSMSGTSMASPYVTGVVGLMLSINPGLTAAQCCAILQRSSRPLPSNDYVWRNDSGFGRIDPDAALAEAASFGARRDIVTGKVV